jgi:hypothetical protein
MKKVYFTRICPKCGKDIFYKTKSALIYRTKKNSNCKNCINAGRTPWNKGIHHSNETKQKISEANKNPSAETRQKMSKSLKGKTPWNKGKKMEEVFDAEKIKEIKQKNALAHTGKNNYLFGMKRSTESKLKMRLSAIKRINNNISNGGQIQPRYNPVACNYFNRLMEQNGVHIQHAENGGEFFIKELGYWVDGYDAENNVVYEFDESHHYSSNGTLKEKDAIRQQEIENILKCKIIRIKESNLILL